MRGRLGLFALLLLFTVISPVWGKGPGENFALVAENEYLQLFLAAQTTEIAVADKRTGTLWYSNPPSRSKDEKVARGAAKTKLNSQLQIVYYTPQIVRREMDSFNDSVELQQFEITYLPQGVRIDYVFGKEWNDRDMLPVMMSVDEFEVLLAGLAKESERDLLRQNYERISLRKREAGDPEIELADVDVAELLGDFVFYVKGKDLSARESRDLHAAVIDSVVENRREIERRGRLRKHHLESLLETLQETDLMLLGRRITKWDSDDMIAAVRASGYSPLRIQKEHKAASLDPPAPRLEVFKIPLIYRLAGENLLVEIPGGDIEFPLEVTDEKGTRVTYPLYTIKVLPYFGAAGVNEEGYIFVPDGSGALINLNNGKTYATAYSQRIYGNDFSFGRLADEATKTQVFLPVFGLKRGDDAFVAIVEQGASLARINGDVAGRTNSYNTVGAEFIVMAMGQISMPGEDWRLMNIFQREPYLGDFRIRIGFLKADAADYVGMARYYQSYLVEKHGLERRGVKDQIPAFLELIGSVRVKRPLLGVPLSVTEPLTTFSDAARIVAELRAGGVENLHLRYSGWLKGGLEHAYPYQAKLERKVGSKKEFAAFSAYLKELGIPFYPDVSLANAYDNRWYRARRDSARQLDKRVGQVFLEEITEWDYNRGLLAARFVVSPRRLENLSQGFLKSYGQFDQNGLALPYMGRQLNSDFGRTYVPRERALEITKNQLKTFQEEGYGLLLDGANAYALPYADSVINVPGNSNGFVIIDQSVPFYQIALRGYLDLAGEAINLSPDGRISLLQALERGLSPYFKLVARDPSVLKGSEFNDLLAVYYNHWQDEAVKLYAEINSVLHDLQGQVIVGHREISPNVFKTTFESGKEIYVNYNSEGVNTAGFYIEAKGYKVKEGGGK